jgi:hypothetical protein
MFWVKNKPDRDEEHLLHQVLHLLKEIMIAQATLDASIQGLTTAVTNAAAALAASSSATSTPDTVVSAYQQAVDAQALALATATPAPVQAAAK